MKKIVNSIHVCMVLVVMMSGSQCRTGGKMERTGIEGAYYYYHENEQGEGVMTEAHYTFTGTNAYFYSSSGQKVAEFKYTIDGRYIYLTPLSGDAKREVLEVKNSSTLLLRFELMGVVYIYKKK